MHVAVRSGAFKSTSQRGQPSPVQAAIDGNAQPHPTLCFPGPTASLGLVCTLPSAPEQGMPPSMHRQAPSAWNMQGAAEIVLRRCVSVMDDEGAAVPLAEDMRAKLEETVTTMASTGLRTLCLTLRDMDEGMAGGSAEFWENPPDEQLTLCCIVGIKVRP